jgi:cell division protein FtsL
MSDNEAQKGAYVGIPDPRPEIDSLTQTVRVIKENVEMLTGAVGNGDYAAVNNGNILPLRESAWTAITTAQQNTVDIAAAASSILALEASITDIEGELTSIATALLAVNAEISDLEAELTGQASTILSLDSRVTVTENDITAISTALLAAEAAITTLEGDVLAAASSILSLEAEVTSINGELASQAAAILAVESEIDDVSAGGYLKITTTATPTSSEATVEIQVKAGTAGTFESAGMRMKADGTGGSVLFLADQFYITDLTTLTTPFNVSGGFVNMTNVRITGTLIIDDTVDYPKLQAGAATAIESTYTSASKTFGSGFGASEEIQTVTITRIASTNAMVHFFARNDRISSTGTSAFTLKKDATDVLYVEIPGDAPYINLFYVDRASTTGSTVYKVDADNATDWGRFDERSIVVTEFRR